MKDATLPETTPPMGQGAVPAAGVASLAAASVVSSQASAQGLGGPRGHCHSDLNLLKGPEGFLEVLLVSVILLQFQDPPFANFGSTAVDPRMLERVSSQATCIHQLESASMQQYCLTPYEACGKYDLMYCQEDWSNRNVTNLDNVLGRLSCCPEHSLARVT